MKGLPRKVRRRRSPVAVLLAALVIAAIAAPAPAAAWKWVFQDFNVSSQGSSVAGRAVAKKCKGGKLGFYDFTSIVTSESLHHEVHADLPVFAKFKQLKNVQLSFEGSAWTNLPPNIQAEILTAYGNFYDTTFARYAAKKNKLIFRHQGLVLFGNQAFPPGEHAEKFKPKPKC
jgi:DNA-binding transcriptional regulator of glucitol operon